MLIHCPQCNAGYEFPPEQLPPDGLRAKCARCGFVMLIRPDIGAIDPSTGLSQVPFKRRPGGSEVSRKIERTAEREIDEGPKVVIDMGQLADAPVVDEDPAEADLPPPIDLAAFAPLSATSSLPPSKKIERRAPNLPAPEPIDPSEIHEVRPPGMWRLVLGVIFGLGGLFVLFVAARNDWNPPWDDPVAAVEQAFEVKERPRARTATTSPAAVVQVDAMKGNLDIRTLIVEKRGRYTLVQGTLVNASNRAQRAIGLDISLSEGPGKPPLKARTVACCDRFSAKEADLIAKNANHPHFSDKFNAGASIRLLPNEQRPFSVVFRRAPGRAMHAEGRIKFSEVEAPTAPQPN
jgi:predicted Zn finger-like uncharacterized protein